MFRARWRERFQPRQGVGTTRMRAWINQSPLNPPDNAGGTDLTFAVIRYRRDDCLLLTAYCSTTLILLQRNRSHSTSMSHPRAPG